MTTKVAPRRFSFATPVTAVMLFAVLALLAAGFVVLCVQTHEIHNIGATIFVFVPVGIAGFVLALRQPSTPIGWLLLLTAVLVTLVNDSKLYSVMDYRLHHGALPLGLVAVFIAGSLSFVAFLLVAPALLLFPEGRMPSERWRWVFWTYVALGFMFVAGQVIAEFGIIGQRIQIGIGGTATNNPTGVLGDFQASFLLFFALILIYLSWIAYQIRHFRRSSGERRQQLKWVGTGAAIALASLLIGIFFNSPSGTGNNVLWQVTRFGIAAFPISIGVAVLKYRLYDIDRLISRTLSYAAVTGLVVGVYVGIVTLTTKTLGFSSPVAVAASTLAAVALFNPLRVRVQRVVDRRFNRARYDAESTVASFRARLRDAVDLETVQIELLAAVARAVEPAHASVWIRGKVQLSDQAPSQLRLSSRSALDRKRRADRSRQAKLGSPVGAPPSERCRTGTSTGLRDIAQS